MPKIFQVPLKGGKVQEDFATVRDYYKERGVTMTAAFKRWLASHAKKIRRMPK